jgi:flagellar hook protein FlgE
VDANGNVIATAPSELRIPNSDIPPRATAAFTAGANLDSRAPTLLMPAFNATDPTTYTSSTSGTIYDSLGNSHVLSLYFMKTASNAWEAFAAVDGATNAAGQPIGVALGGAASQALSFDSSGAMTMPNGTIPVQIDLNAIAGALGKVNGAVSPLNCSLDVTSMTQFGTEFSVNTLVQDGYMPGRLTGFTVNDDGYVRGQYSNGQSKNLGQIVLAAFNNPQGLRAVGGGQWEESTASGLPIVGAPGTGSLGALQASAVEDSNVDLTAELVSMITAQRVYQANAQSIKTQDSVLQTVVNLR